MISQPWLTQLHVCGRRENKHEHCINTCRISIEVHSVMHKLQNSKMIPKY